MSTVADGIARMRERGLTVALTERGTIRVAPVHLREPVHEVWLKDNQAEVVAYLRGETQPETMQVELDKHSTPNYTMVPNVLLDFILPALDLAERAVLLYLYRRTVGFHKTSDCVSISQICHGVRGKDGQKDAGTGLSRPTAIRALKGLQERGYIEAHHSDFKTTRFVVRVDSVRTGKAT